MVSEVMTVKDDADEYAGSGHDDNDNDDEFCYDNDRSINDYNVYNNNNGDNTNSDSDHYCFHYYCCCFYYYRRHLQHAYYYDDDYDDDDDEMFTFINLSFINLLILHNNVI